MTSAEEFLAGGGFTVEAPKLKSVSAEEFLAEPAIETEPEDGGVPTVAETLDLDPNIQRRGFLFPTGVDEEGKTVATPSEAMLMVMEGMRTVRRALKGETITPIEVLDVASMMLGGTPRGIAQAVKTVRGVPAREAAEEGLEAATLAAEGVAGATGRAERRAAQDADVTGVTLGQPVEDATTAARAARFEEQGIPSTRGDVTQKFADQARESRLLSMASGDEGEPLRQFRLQQSDVFTAKVNELTDSLGVPTETGQRIKDALSGRIELLNTERKNLYREVAESAPELVNAPLITDDIVRAIPNKQTEISVRRSSPGAVDAINEALVEFGLDASDEATEAFLKKDGEITPLTLGNFDEFRKELNRIVRSAPPEQQDNIARITGPIMRALDEEAGFIDSAIRESGVTDQSVVNTLNEARARVRTLKTEFSPQAITGRLTDVKRDGVTPVVEASKVSNELLRPGAPIENLERTITSLRNAGKKGTAAIGDIQATVVMDALEAALKAPSRKVDGREVVGGNQFAKALDKFGDDKLDLLFKNNPAALKALRDLKQTGLDMTATAGAIPKGSAAVILDKLNQFGNRIPGIDEAVALTRMAVKAAGDSRAAQKVFESPVVQRRLKTFNLQYPNLAAKLGILSILPQVPVGDIPGLEDIA